MDLERLISAIVRQTTVLIARLSTAGGTRSPLANIADQVFVGLVGELERHGLGKKVVADMFGLALRSYQLKVQRLQESASDTGVTLWTALRSFIEERGAVSRADIITRFSRNEEASVRGILADLVESGVCSRTGRGDASIYRIAPSDDLTKLAADSAAARVALVWLTVCREGPLSREAIARSTGLPQTELGEALVELVNDSRVQRATGADGDTYSAERCLIPVGDAAGWEAAVIDHHQAVLNALAAKIAGGTHRSAAADETGGATYNFELWPGHPHEAEVRGLLARKRSHVAGLWDRVSAHNAQVQHGEQGRYSVSFYLGQCLRFEQRVNGEDEET
jgi:hypothetical protein